MQNIDQLISTIYSKNESTIIIRELISHITKQTIATQLVSKSQLNDIERNELKIMVNRLMTGEPLQYVIGETTFYGNKIVCDKRALIPRSETEELVDWIVNEENKNTDLNIIDIGTGTGAIAISLYKSLSNATIFAVDISKEAIDLAKENSKTNNCNINFIECSIFDLNSSSVKYDIIVSNPPYICNSEIVDMEQNVVDYEPHMALFVDDNDPLIFYRKIAEYGIENLNRGGRIYFEINQQYGEEVVELLENIGYSKVILRKDINNNDRMVGGTL